MFLYIWLDRKEVVELYPVSPVCVTLREVMFRMNSVILHTFIDDSARMPVFKAALVQSGKI